MNKLSNDEYMEYWENIHKKYKEDCRGRGVARCGCCVGFEDCDKQLG